MMRISPVEAMGSSTQQPALHDQRSDRDCIEHLRPLLRSPLLSLITMVRVLDRQ
jgi:hypothetical protein